MYNCNKPLCKLLLLLLLMMKVQGLSAQPGVGVDLSTQSFYDLADGFPLSLGVGVQANYRFNTFLRVIGGYSYYFPTEYRFTQISNRQFFFHAQTPIVGNFRENGLVFYALVGGAGNTYKIINLIHSPNPFTLTGKDGTFTSGNFQLGVGLEKSFQSRMRLFGEFVLAIGGSRTSNSFNPGYYNISAGVRLDLKK